MSRHSHTEAPLTGITAAEGRTREQLRHALDQAAHLLPAQGPIGVFVHHNTLHAFQHLPFETAVTEAARIFGTEPFLAEDEYQAARQQGRIREEDIDAVLFSEPDTVIWAGTLTRRELRRAMLIPGVRHFSAANIEWQIDECGLLTRLRRDLPSNARGRLLQSQNSEASATRALFAACFHRLPPAAPPPAEPAARPRDGLLTLCGVDTDAAIHPWLIRLCAAYLDQGLSYWPMPNRENGFYAAVRDLHRQPGMIEPELLRGMSQAFAELAAAGKSAEDVVLDYLHRFQVTEAEWQALLTAELLALPGWAGMVRRLEEVPDLAPYEEIPSSLMDYLAVRLTLNTVAAENVWRRSGHSEPLESAWHTLPESTPPNDAEQIAAAAHLFDVAQLLGMPAQRIEKLSVAEFSRWYEEVLLFNDWERRRILHLAYERRHEQLILQPLQLHRQTLRLQKPDRRPAAQVFFCLDDREESIRRALEELDREVETFGAAGFYGVAVNFQGLDDPHGVPLCPVVVTPRHAVLEKPHSEEDSELHTRRQNRRRLWADLARGTLIGTRTLARGWIGTMGLGLISLVPLITRVLAPHTAGRVYRWLDDRLLPEPRTELTVLRQDDTEHDTTEGLLLGFSLEEKADCVASVLRPCGLVRDFARIVVILGHGATTNNNPHESAYCCGACGGRRGGPNARLFAAMANHPEVRELLRERGVFIPADTWFVGGYHDTCTDDIDLFDLNALPASHRADFERIRKSLDRARAANALERSRRYEAAWKAETPESALRHVQERAEHLAEPRPEFGHGTNAVCIIGRRAITRGLFLDRRVFLTSYDPELDPNNDLLAAQLGAAGPVCAGINLEYYFSTVDNEKYGCGTKLPHNVTGLLGVMDGHASDLRTGLPKQTVEIHEPVRLLLLVESTPERMMEAAGRSAVVTELIRNRWMRIATIDPNTGAVYVYRDGAFLPLNETSEPLPEVPSSPAWYAGKLEHLPIARITTQASGVC